MCIQLNTTRHPDSFVTQTTARDSRGTKAGSECALAIRIDSVLCLFHPLVIKKARQNCAMKRLLPLPLLTLVSLVASVFARAEKEATAIECIKSATFLAP